MIFSQINSSVFSTPNYKIPKSQEMMNLEKGAKNQKTKDKIMPQDDFVSSGINQKVSQSIDLSKLFSQKQANSLSTVSEMLNDSFDNVIRQKLEDRITSLLADKNIQLGRGNFINFTVDGNGTISVHDGSITSIDHGKNIKNTSTEEKIAYTLNNSDFEGKSLGKSLLEDFSREKSIELEDIKPDDSFSFTLVHNASTGRNEIIGVKYKGESAKSSNLTSKHAHALTEILLSNISKPQESFGNSKQQLDTNFS